MTQQIGFAGQLQPQQLKEVAERGFKSVINNRPDYEEGAHQPTAAAIQAAAQEQGLSYVHQPVVSGQITQQDVEAFAKYINELPKPVLAFCRTGNRCNNLYQLAKQMDLLDD
ncbi:MAG: TIGR01244 family phosphatase [Moraxellaceae bacterium]|nr:TIGR01244 family phosphatase [Pseudomonadales bacterium]MCP5174996.1 TIGR01244 family phosphatase [Moraxellaceae bacterium]HQV22238.1 TIGR01244 family sulfur transferase [Agitococcus sp.]